jgi:hypothetical protein
MVLDHTLAAYVTRTPACVAASLDTARIHTTATRGGPVTAAAYDQGAIVLHRLATGAALAAPPFERWTQARSACWIECAVPEPRVDLGLLPPCRSGQWFVAGPPMPARGLGTDVRARFHEAASAWMRSTASSQSDAEVRLTVLMRTLAEWPVVDAPAAPADALHPVMRRAVDETARVLADGAAQPEWLLAGNGRVLFGYAWHVPLWWRAVTPLSGDATAAERVVLLTSRPPESGREWHELRPGSSFVATADGCDARLI